MAVTHKPERQLYIVLISMHGLIRAKDLELGRDADTGGQILYVVELARALAQHPDVARVDLLTRRVEDPRVDKAYADVTESICTGANIIRLNCGPRRYLRKEVLWPHIQGFIDSALQHVRNIGRVPDIVHSHYADAGLAGSRLAGLLGVPLIHTGHSLGREKLSRLLARGMKESSIETQYHMSTRIEAEEIVLGTAARVIASTRQEIDEQYANYDNYQPSRMMVIPPGVDLSRFHPADGSEIQSQIAGELQRFLQDPQKPMILALSRPDERKNISALLQAYGESTVLQSKANLVIVAGNRDRISEMDKGPREVLTDILMQIDRYDLYGKVAYPKHHSADEVPILYRLAALSHGVFINPALTEPFGLTLIEAAASGLPILATNDGGPKEIISKCKNGQLINPLDISDIKRKLMNYFSKADSFKRYSEAGIQGAHRHFSWPGHVQSYIREVKTLLSKHKRHHHVRPSKSRLPTIDRLAISAIDNALFGDEHSMRELQSQIQEQGGHCGFGFATGRTLQNTMSFIHEAQLTVPDILITANGTEIYYYHHGRSDGRAEDRGLIEDAYWPLHIDYRWEREALLKIMRRVPGIKLLAQKEQTSHRIRYRIQSGVTPTPLEIKRLLRTHDLHAKVVVTEDKIMDLLPIRASKGLAIRYIAMKWGLALDRILVVGDSGSDEEMLLGDTLGVVVGNHTAELDKLKGKPRIYFAKGHYAQGILEGLAYYHFFTDLKFSDEEDMDGMQLDEISTLKV